MIILKNINKVYGKEPNHVYALKNVNLVIENGKFTAIIGKSGSGKTTLMNLIGGLDKPTSGIINVNDTEITNLSNRELARFRNKKTGFVFQSFFLEPNYSVLDNVCMPLMVLGIKKKEREQRAKEILVKLGLENKIHKNVNELSGGEKQRVSISRALVSNPDIILADEPTGNLDNQNGNEVMKLLRKIADEGKCVILVTHNLEAAKNADNVIEINDGYVTADYLSRYEEILK